MYAQTVMNTATDLMLFDFPFDFSRVFSPFAFPPSFGKDQGRVGDYLLVCDSSVVLCFSRRVTKERVE